MNLSKYKVFNRNGVNRNLINLKQISDKSLQKLLHTSKNHNTERKLSGIRVTYSGLFTLVFSLLGIITGLVFLIIITRSLSPEDYGTWGVINSLFVYSLVINSIVTFWSPREVARGNDTIKTALSFGWSLSVVGIIIYIIRGLYNYFSFLEILRNIFSNKILI